MPSPPLPRTEVGCELVFDVDERADLALQVAVAASAGEREVEELVVTLDGDPVDVREVVVDHGRTHLVQCGPGRLTISYHAVVLPAPVAEADPADEADVLVARRQSRYAPSDALGGFARRELADLPDGPERARAVGDWVFEQIAYELESTGPLDTAVETLLSGNGVCRDFAHLTVALCRALDLPARFVSVYAPGLSPMDFHAVTEVAVDGRWEVIDATKLAPRPSLVRITHGRDAADTAFAMTTAGDAELVSSTVTASVDGDLPRDDHRGPAYLA